MIFENLIPYTVVFSLIVAVICTACIPVILYFYAGKVRYVVDDGWREHPPKLISVLRRIFELLTNGAGIGMVDHFLSNKERARIGEALGKAGFSYRVLVAEFALLKFSALVVGTVAFYLLLKFGYRLAWQPSLTVSVLLGMVGYVYPEFWLRRCVKNRKLKFQREFPFFLDAVVLTMQAGLAFSAALEHAVKISPPGPVKQEFDRLLSEVRCGVDRSDALQNLAVRMGLPELSNFVAVVSQAAESGGSLTNSLTEQARQRRRERFQRAEKLAGQAPVKLLGPLFLFIFPILFIIIGAPVALDLVESGFLS